MSSIFNLLLSFQMIYLILIMLVMIIINIVLSKLNVKSNYKYLINGVSLIFLALVLDSCGDIIEGRFLSVKLYIVILIITNIIMLFTISNKFKLVYEIVNYILFGLMSLILGSILLIIVLNEFNLLPLAFSEYIVILINVSAIIFSVYLVVVSIIYIIKNIGNKERYEVSLEEVFDKTKDSLNEIKDKYLSSVREDDRLTLEELLELENKSEFSINGVECGIIFEDSIKENIFKNYNILLDDINAKLVNGYTLEENRLLKSICMKLNTNNLSSIDLNNLSILNKITPEEYSLLKRIYEN